MLTRCGAKPFTLSLFSFEPYGASNVVKSTISALTSKLVSPLSTPPHLGRNEMGLWWSLWIWGVVHPTGPKMSGGFAIDRDPPVDKIPTIPCLLPRPPRPRPLIRPPRPRDAHASLISIAEKQSASFRSSIEGTLTAMFTRISRLAKRLPWPRCRHLQNGRETPNWKGDDFGNSKRWRERSRSVWSKRPRGRWLSAGPVEEDKPHGEEELRAQRGG